jgi:hypothetical protein
MMRWSQKHLAVAMAWAWLLTTSAANAVVLDFAGLDAINLEHPVDYYAGGFGSLGSGPGPDYGVTFSPGLYICAAAPASGCSTALVPSGNPLIPGGGSSIMNVANGFTTGLSFYYSSEHGAGAIIYTGLDATGTILATLDLPGNNEGGGGFGGADCFFTAYCPYTAIGIAFAGTAYSVDFVPITGDVAFADINLGVSSACPRLPPTPRHRPRSDGLACVAQKENGT